MTGTDALGRHIVEKSRRVRGAHSATDASSDPITLRMRRVNIHSYKAMYHIHIFIEFFTVFEFSSYFTVTFKLQELKIVKYFSVSDKVSLIDTASIFHLTAVVFMCSFALVDTGTFCLIP